MVIDRALLGSAETEQLGDRRVPGEYTASDWQARNQRLFALAGQVE